VDERFDRPLINGFVCSRKGRRGVYARCADTQSTVLQGKGQVTSHDRSYCARVHRLLDPIPSEFSSQVFIIIVLIPLSHCHCRVGMLYI